MRVLASIVVSATLFGCAAPAPAPPAFTQHAALADIPPGSTLYVAPARNFSQRYRSHEALLESITQHCAATLRAAGHRVLPTTEFEDAWSTASSEVGGLYDERSGKRSARKYGMCLRKTLGQLRRRRAFTGVALPSVVYSSVELETPYTSAQWDGVTRRVQFEGGAPNSRWTTQLAMSLKTQVYTADGRIAYEGVGGLDFSHKTLRKTGKIELVPREASEFAADRLTEGIQIAFRGMTERRLRAAGAAEARR